MTCAFVHYDSFRRLSIIDTCIPFQFFLQVNNIKEIEKYKRIVIIFWRIILNHSVACWMTRLFVITRNLFFCNSFHVINIRKTIVAFKLFHVMFVLRSINWFWREVINDNKRIFIYIVKRFDSIELKQKRRELNDEIKDSWDIPL